VHDSSAKVTSKSKEEWGRDGALKDQMPAQKGGDSINATGRREVAEESQHGGKRLNFPGKTRGEGAREKDGKS